MYYFNLYSIEDSNKEQIYNMYDDEEMSLKIYKRLEFDKEYICSKTDEFTIEELWYSQYYWFLVIMKERNAMQQADYRQQLLKILEDMDSAINIDWKIIEQLEKEFL